MDRVAAQLVRHERGVLIIAAAAPFVPDVCEFLRLGIPDTLLTGDPATLELRTLRAARFEQLLGPYSRFLWSHPGPMYFYLALPVYEAFQRRGRALNLFALVTNLASATAFVLSSRKLRGLPFALAAAALLAAYECIAGQFQLADEWNPVVTILPFALLSLLSVRLGLCGVRVLPVFAFVGSALVQTHVGYLPVVVVLSVLAAAMARARRLAIRQHTLEEIRTPRGPVVAFVAILALVWLPTIAQAVREHPSNVELLVRFFTSARTPDHRWAEVAEAICHPLAVLPLAVARELGFPAGHGPRLEVGVGVGYVVLLSAVLVHGLRRGDRALACLSSVALGEIACALPAVHAIQGAIYWHLVLWLSAVSLVASAALVAALFPPAADDAGRPVAAGPLVLSAFVAATTIGFSVRAETRRVNVFLPPAEPTVERFARDVQDYLVSWPGPPPVVHVATHDTWPTVAAVVLRLYHESIPVFVERDWLFLVGDQFRPDSTVRPALWIGDHTFCDAARTRSDLRQVATAENLCAYVSSTGAGRER
jgi:hypothetical protein